MVFKIFRYSGFSTAIFGLLITLLMVCGPKPGQQGYVNRAVINGTIKDMYGDPLYNIPIRFEVLTSDPSRKGFLRTVTDTSGAFSFSWDELIRKDALLPVYILHTNFARDFLRNDKYEYMLRKCSYKGETGDNIIPVSIEGSATVDLVLGHHMWVESDQCKVRTGPSIQQEEIADLYKATKVIMIDQKSEWCLVKIPTSDLNSFPIYDKQGWVYKPLLSEQYIPPVSYKERQRDLIIRENSDWSSTFIDLIKDGKVGKGMSKEMVRASKGDPINTEVDDADKKKIITKWEYGSVIKKTVTFLNDQVESWD